MNKVTNSLKTKQNISTNHSIKCHLPQVYSQFISLSFGTSCVFPFTSIIKEWVSFFLGSWDMNRSAEQTNRTRTAKRFVCSALRFISHEPRKKDTHSLYLQCLQQRPLLKFSEQSKKFKFPAEIGHLTLFPDKTIIAYSFRQNSAWINGEKVVCCECFHTLKQY